MTGTVLRKTAFTVVKGMQSRVAKPSNLTVGKGSMVSTGFAIRMSQVCFFASDTTTIDDALSVSMDRIRGEFSRMQQAERERNTTELVSRAEEVIQVGTVLLKHSSFASGPSDVEQELKQKLGLVHFKLGSVAEEHETHMHLSLGYLTQVAHARGSLFDWFNVATVAACAGDVRRSQAALTTLKELYAEAPQAELGDFLPWHNVLHYHACALRDGSFYQEALPHVETLRDAYKELHVTDIHFLLTRGLPSFPDFLKLAKSVLDPLPGIDSGKWLRKLYQHVDPEGQQSIDSINKTV